MRPDRDKFLCGKATFRPNEQGRWGRAVAQQGGGAAFIGNEQRARGRPTGDQRVQGYGGQNFGYGQALTLLGGFNGDGAQPVQINMISLGAGGDDRLDARDPKLGGFFNHKVGFIAFEQRKAKPGIRFGGLRAGLAERGEDQFFTSKFGDLGAPFTVLAVE